MDITKTLYVTTREEWRDWLAANYDAEPEIWLVSYRKHTGRSSLPYSSAVEEALCFGWIDSIQKGIDADRFAQRFSPRRPGSSYSQTNKERLARLIRSGRVFAPVLKSMGDIRPEDYQMADDILAALRADDAAWAFFLSTSPSYQRIRSAYVDVARNRPAEFEKRLAHLVDMCAKAKQFGHGIEDYY